MPLQEQVEKEFCQGNPGAIMAQVYPDKEYMVCIFCSNNDVKKMYSALGMELPKI